MSTEVIGADDVAAILGISRSLLTHVVRLSGVRFMRASDGKQSLRAEDAALVAGLATALYHEDVAERLVKASLAEGSTSAFRTQGADLLGLDLAPQPPTRPVPADAVLRHSHGAPPPRQHRASPSDEACEEILAEINACLTILQSSR
ncbi:MAG: hypothetical protein AAF580_09990 [Pseudomonadota bacterium]